MAEFGYDETKIAEGKTLLDATRTAFDLNKTEDNETTAARSAFDKKVEELEELYAKHRKSLKLLLLQLKI